MPSVNVGLRVGPWLLPALLLLGGCSNAELQAQVDKLQKEVLVLQNRLDRNEERVAGLELTAARSGLSTAPSESSLPVDKLVPPATGAGEAGSADVAKPTEGQPVNPGAAPPSPPVTPAATPATRPKEDEPRPLIKLDGSKKSSRLQNVGPDATRPSHFREFGHNLLNEVGETWRA